MNASRDPHATDRTDVSPASADLRGAGHTEAPPVSGPTSRLLPSERTPPASPAVVPTWIEVHYPGGRGAIGLRGNHAPLSWEVTTAPTRSFGDRHLFRVPVREGELLELKVVRGEDWAHGRNYVVHAGEHLSLEPSFDAQGPVLLERRTIRHEGRSVGIDVLLPPSYDEQPSRRYPVLYVLDGQSLWSHSPDPFGNWALEQTMASLYDLGAVEELIVVGIDTSEHRLSLLGPVPDPNYGGGEGEDFLDLVTSAVVPHVDAEFRTIGGRAATGILGSSMGGLFAFFAAWKRPDVFGKAACLSSSFWWADRWAVRLVESSAPPEPRPTFYLDSGASPHQMEEDARVVDGFHHTRSMMRALTRAGFDVGSDVQRLVFPGHTHHAGAWASRVALPLQLLFPQGMRPIDDERLAQASASP